MVTRKKEHALGTESWGLSRIRRFYYAEEKQDSLGVAEKVLLEWDLDMQVSTESALLLLQRLSWSSWRDWKRLLYWSQCSWTSILLPLRKNFINLASREREFWVVGFLSLQGNVVQWGHETVQLLICWFAGRIIFLKNAYWLRK